jgi:hypothetical protein
MSEADTPKEQSNKPKGDAFRQQKLKAWQPIMTPFKVVALFFAIGVSFIPTGVHLLSVSNSVYENVIMYDGSDANIDCSITTANQGRQCNVSSFCVAFMVSIIKVFRSPPTIAVDVQFHGKG